MADINSITFESGWAGGSTADYNHPYLTPNANIATFYDGIFYTNSTWDEGGNECCVVDLDTPALLNGGGYSHGWGLSGGYAIAVNSTYVFQPVIMDNQGGSLAYPTANSYFPPFTTSGGNVDNSYAWSGFIIKNRSDMSIVNHTQATYTPSMSNDTNVLTGIGFDNVVTKICQYPDTVSGVRTNIDARIRGVAATETLLYISDSYNSRMLILNISDLSVAAALSVDSSIGQIAIASDGNIWAIISGTVSKLDSTTGALITSIATGYVTTPYSIGVLSDGTLWASDNSAAQRLVLFTDNGSSTATFASYYGDDGGIYANNGAFADTKFATILSYGRSETNSYVLWSPEYGTMATKHDDSDGGVVTQRYSGLVFIDCLDIAHDVVTFSDVGSTTWTVPSGVTNVEVLVVAGGGGGGDDTGGGGGGGGVIYRQEVTVVPNDVITVVVGNGGSKGFGVGGQNGGNSSFADLTAIGGGGGGSNFSDNSGSSGGSGGGGSNGQHGSLGTADQGHTGGTSTQWGGNFGCGGGGGAGSAGSDGDLSHGGNGGNGVASSISGSTVYYGGGGGGGTYQGGTLGSGGLGGGGAATISGTNGLGGGGGGSIDNGNNAANGGSGVVIIKMIGGKAYSVRHVFSVDTTKPLGQQLVPIGVTKNPFSYPHDMRDTFGSYAAYYRAFGGRKFLIARPQTEISTLVYEIIDGTYIARPAGGLVINPAQSISFTGTSITATAIWHPTSDGSAAPQSSEWTADPANGLHIFTYIDDAGTIWRTYYNSSNYNIMYIQQIPFESIDSYGNPNWSWTNAITELAPSNFIGHAESPTSFRAFYNPSNDTMLLTGYDANHNFVYADDWWGMAGKIFCYYENWNGVDGVRTLKYTIIPPFTANAEEIRSVDLRGDILAVGYMTPPIIRLYNLNTGAYLGQMQSNGLTGENDTWIDSASAVRVVKVDETNYRIFAEREVGGSCLMYNVTTVPPTLSGQIIRVGDKELYVNGTTIQSRPIGGTLVDVVTDSIGSMPSTPTGLAIKDVYLSDGSIVRVVNGVVGYQASGNHSFIQIGI